MGQAYTPGLKVTTRMTHKVRRILPIAGEVKVSIGDRVHADDIVAETFMPGDIRPINMSNLLSVPPGDVKDCMLCKEGDVVEVGDPLAQTKGMFGMFKNIQKAQYAGTLETVSEVTGQVILRGDPIPVQVRAYITGTVIKVLPDEGCEIEADCSFVQGIFGIGGETHGPIVLACKTHEQELTEDLITPEMKGSIVVGGARVTDSAIRKAVSVGAAAVVSGGMDDQDLKEFLGYDLGVAITGSENVGLTVVITEGFGEIAMAERTYRLLESRKGCDASINGATQIRAGVMRPEIIIPISETDQVEAETSELEAGLLALGRQVRVIRDPYFGLIGEVSGLPQEQQVLGSGSKARVLEVKFDSGESVVVPRANVELIEA